MTPHIGKSLTKNARQFPANWRRKIHVNHVAHKLRSYARVLPIARDHPCQEINQMAWVEIERLELLNQMSHICRFVLHQLLDFQYFLLAFAIGKAGTHTQRIQTERDGM